MVFDKFYVIPVVFGVVIALIFVLIHNKKLKSGKKKFPNTGTRNSGNSIGIKNQLSLTSADKNIEDRLLENDFGVDVTSKIVRKLNETQLNIEEVLISFLDVEQKSKSSSSRNPHTIMFVGVNGVGKTTTLGKIAYKYASEGKSSIIAASDTYRAAAAEQLQIWKKRANSVNSPNAVDVVASDETKKDPATVAFVATQKAISSKSDCLLIDTAGRMHNNKNLMDELKKVQKVIEKQKDVDEIYLVVDGSQGQTAVKQAIEFNKYVDITGVCVTKLDGTAKGGVVFAIVNELNVPIKYIGLGEGADDLQEFDAKTFVKLLLGE